MDDDDLDYQEISDRANARANMIAPPATRDPVAAGMSGAFVTGLTVVFFGAVAGLDEEKYVLAYFLTAAVGFGAPYLHYKLQNNRHYAEVAKQFIYLTEEARRAKRT